MSTEQENLDSDVSIGPKPIGGVVEEDEVNEIIGHIVNMTTGELIVPRSFLKETFHKHNVPPKYLPEKPTKWMAFRRAKALLLEEGDPVYEVWSNEYNTSLTCALDLKASKEKGNNVFHLYTEVFWPEDLVGEEGGRTSTSKIGYIDYDNETKQPILEPTIDEESPHWFKWVEMKDLMGDLFEKMQDHHTGQDLRNLLQDFKEVHTNSVKIRRAVYFVGAHHSQTVEALSAAWDDLNQHKDEGERCEIATIPVINTENQRELIESRARDMMEEQVESVTEAAFEEIGEEDDVEEIAEDIVDNLSDLDGFAAEYNQLLETRLSVKNVLKERMQDLEAKKEEIIEEALEKHD